MSCFKLIMFEESLHVLQYCSKVCWPYSWWKKSGTRWYEVYPIICRALYIPGGAGFLQSTVSCSHLHRHWPAPFSFPGIQCCVTCLTRDWLKIGSGMAVKILRNPALRKYVIIYSAFNLGNCWSCQHVFLLFSWIVFCRFIYIMGLKVMSEAMA